MVQKEIKLFVLNLCSIYPLSHHLSKYKSQTKRSKAKQLIWCISSGSSDFSRRWNATWLLHILSGIFSMQHCFCPTDTKACACPVNQSFCWHRKSIGEHHDRGALHECVCVCVFVCWGVIHLHSHCISSLCVTDKADSSPSFWEDRIAIQTAASHYWHGACASAWMTHRASKKKGERAY